MTVQDNRNSLNIPPFMLEILYPNTRSEITQADKDAWIAKLESGDSVKAVGVFHDDSSNAACALGHLNNVAPDLMFIPSALYDNILKLNDVEDLSLSEIAMWVKENVEVYR